jgi:hypothetical protein
VEAPRHTKLLSMGWTRTKSESNNSERSQKRRAHLSMADRPDQVARRAAGVIVFLMSAALPAAADDGHRRQLAAECDAFLRDALKTPYGWGWTVNGARPANARPGAPRAAAIDLRATAAAGLVLHLAGVELQEARYAQAAVQAARAVAAVQANSGQVPGTGIIRANAGGRDEPAAVPARAATCAGIGLMLALAGDGGDTEGRDAANAALFRRAALKAANWLGTQQTRPGGWPVAYPPDAAPGDALRVVRLDTPAYRDATIALWLSAHVLDDDRLRTRAERAVGELVTLRIADAGGAGHDLWSTAYNLDETLHTKVDALSPAIDAQASRMAMQALLAACLLGGDEATAPVLREAAEALARLPKENGRWRRRYDWNLRLPSDPPAAPEPDEEEVGPPSAVFDLDSSPPGEWEPAVGVDEIIRAARRLDKLGPEGYAKQLGAQMPVTRRLALVLCGLDDEALTAEAPPRWVEGPKVDEFDERLRRAAVLVWRVRLGTDDRPPDGEKQGGE